ncbi:possible anti-sigma factor [Bacteroides pyogenes JCM 10003]|nr:possible anti-sigma factor [Bacteroides pyogenes JCM 10003]
MSKEMKDWKEILEKHLEEGKLPLIEPMFTRKAEVRETLERLRKKNRVAGAKTVNGLFRKRTVYWSAAAMLALLFGLGSYLLSEEKVSTDAVAMECKLPDGSHVQVMEDSMLSFNRIGWLWNRSLHLSGKAFFSVNPGKTFTVHTRAGNVSVLGTKFWVEQKGSEITVSCKEGYVKLETPIGVTALAAGESVHCDEKGMGTVERELKLRRILGYEKDPLVNVVADIEEIFQIKVIGREKCEGLFYDGIIYTRNLEETLKRVFGSFGIKYELCGKEVILL